MQMLCTIFTVVHITVDAESKYNFVIFLAFVKSAIQKQKLYYWSTMLYANALHNFYCSQLNTSPSKTKVLVIIS